jgi:hypothetical protein
VTEITGFERKPPDRETKTLLDLAPPELLHRSKPALRGSIRQAWIQGGIWRGTRPRD